MNLKSSRIYGENSKNFYKITVSALNYVFLNFVIRKALRENTIFRSKIRTYNVCFVLFILFVCLFVCLFEIGYVNDLENLRIPIPDFVNFICLVLLILHHSRGYFIRSQLLLTTRNIIHTIMYVYIVCFSPFNNKNCSFSLNAIKIICPFSLVNFSLLYTHNNCNCLGEFKRQFTKHLSIILPRKTLDQMYKALVRSHFDYCDILYHIPSLQTQLGVCLIDLIGKAERIQYQAALAITGAW